MFYCNDTAFGLGSYEESRTVVCFARSKIATNIDAEVNLQLSRHWALKKRIAPSLPLAKLGVSRILAKTRWSRSKGLVMKSSAPAFRASTTRHRQLGFGLASEGLDSRADAGGASIHSMADPGKSHMAYRLWHIDGTKEPYAISRRPALYHPLSLAMLKAATGRLTPFNWSSSRGSTSTRSAILLKVL